MRERAPDPAVPADPHRAAMALYEEGVAAVIAWTRDERLPPDEHVCGHWSRTDVVRHLAVVAGWYHDWLDRAIEGNAEAPFRMRDFDGRNEAALHALGDLGLVQAATRFEVSARSYLERARNHLDRPFGFPYGTATVGAHLGAAAGEWHIHAWDLDHSHSPSDPAALFTAVATCLADTRSRAQRRLLRTLIPLGARRSPWITLLKRSGRHP